MQQSVWGTCTSLQTHIFCPQETAFRCTGESEAFWVNTTWLNCTLFEKKLMAFIWLWARPDFLHFYLGLLVISHVTTILLQYCAWRWRQGEIYFKSGKYIDNTVSCMLYWGNWGTKTPQAVRKTGRELRCPYVWDCILSTGTHSSSIWEIHGKERLRKMEELRFLLFLQFWLTSSTNHEGCKVATSHSSQMARLLVKQFMNCCTL